MIQAIQQGLKEEGFEVSVAQLCRWFDVPVVAFTTVQLSRRATP